jgi:hydrogenase expression/formation protein HypE
MAIMATRESTGFETGIESDSASLWPVVAPLLNQLGPAIHVLRDPTRGGVASALNEIAQAAGVGIELEESSLPIPAAVQAGCEMLGLDPLYVANEGILVAMVPETCATAALKCLRADPLGAEAAVIGRVVDDHRGFVVLHTSMGGTRIVDMLPGDQLPRIC